MEAQNFSALFVTAAVIVLIYLLLPRYKAPKLSLPPGPKADSMPTHDPWVQYRDWGKEYGQLVYVRDRNILILNNLQVAIDLLENRARIYSDREASLQMDLSGMTDLNLAFQRYSNKWRKNRKVFQQNFRQATITRFYPAQYKQVQLFLQRMINVPNDFMQHIMMLSQGAIYSALYGIDDVEPNDRIAQKAAEVVQVLFDVILLSGAFPMLDRFPWLQYLPSWIPGCGFKRITNDALQGMEEAKSIPFDLAVNNFKTGLGSSLIAELAVQNEGNSEEIEAIKAMGLVSLLASSDTTGSSINSFFLAMVMYPDIQAKGQEEIDCVIGTDRLPTFEDRQSLPYVESIYREVMRLDPPLPLSIYHASIEDDFYRGYHIPKGCVVIPNIWAMNRDPDIYQEPDKFLPERFLNSPQGPFTRINDIYAFGFGRRVCTGRYMADNTVWLAIASVLATLTLSKAKDTDGNEINISGEFSHGFFRHPKPFKCSIVPRSSYAQELILTAKLSADE
ncbi:hypothetical protein GYMLUDRAFT_218866 [Collybiopsis luxurians FD-317 M1]|nr:hypothetical protein GYMLUDRAFT_218866 [Collybiopsis luxurians FD-317 M1]